MNHAHMFPGNPQAIPLGPAERQILRRALRLVQEHRAPVQEIAWLVSASGVEVPCADVQVELESLATQLQAFPAARQSWLVATAAECDLLARLLVPVDMEGVETLYHYRSDPRLSRADFRCALNALLHSLRAGAGEGV